VPPASAAASLAVPAAESAAPAADLSHVHAAIPQAVADTGHIVRAAPRAPLVAPPVGYPGAPEALRRAATREQAVSQFCFQEFGQKIDPMLEGAVAVVVTMAGGSIAGAHVASANWTDSHLGAQVDRCLDERIAQAWRLPPEDSAGVPPGRYVVYLGFRRS